MCVRERESERERERERERASARDRDRQRDRERTAIWSLFQILKYRTKKSLVTPINVEGVC